MTAPPLPLGARPLAIADVVRAARPGTEAAFTPEARARIAAAAAIVERHAAAETPVYGLNTGLGGNLGHRVRGPEMAGFQERIIRGRGIGVGDAQDVATCRATLFCRLAELAGGAPGVTPEAAELLLAMFNRGVVPVLPEYGSIGASDLGVMAALGAVMIGRGEAWHAGQRMPGAEALAAAGLAPAQLGPKDGLALISHTAATTARAALALDAAARLMAAHVPALALALEGYAGNPAILDPRLAAARPAPGQAEAAAALRAALAGSALLAPGAPRNLQDALSFRVAAPILGAVRACLDHAVAQVEIELNGVTVTPLVLLDTAEILSAPNFHAPALTIALDALAAALSHAATASALRLCKLMTARFSGLPAYLSPVGGASAGYVSLQKTAGDLLAEIRHAALPSGMDALLVSDTAEDMAPLTPHAVRRLERLLVPLRWLFAIEALAAAQAVDLRGLAPLGAGTAPLHAAIRARVPPLGEDREPGPDVAEVAAVLDSWAPPA